jgi:adenosylcobyric acid synthase
MAALMVQGVSSSAGKSVLTTAFARAFARRGVDVVPFKAQNMSNNARVVAGGEIGVAQYLQALAAGVEPDVRMNPVLVKPEGDDQSQVVVLGRPDLDLSRQAWRARSARLWPPISRALSGLLAEHELVLIEGAGSPAEINLRASDLANMRTASAAGARVVLVADIDRGGAFAHLYGTWSLLPPAERALVSGFVLNKFRGDAALLPPAPQRLAALTGVETLGVIPWLEHGLPDEDGAADPSRSTGGGFRVAVVRYPTASNLDEFKPLEQVAQLRWASRLEDLDADLVVLPGSKHVVSDLNWLRRRNLDRGILARAAAGLPVLGICGGMQMLGTSMVDRAGVDGDADGLGLLPLETTFRATKLAAAVETRFAALPSPWSLLTGQTVSGYEIRHGESVASGPVVPALSARRGFVAGPVLGVSVHGLFENAAVVAALVGRLPEGNLDVVFDDLADVVEEHLDVGLLLREAGIGSLA